MPLAIHPSEASPPLPRGEVLMNGLDQAYRIESYLSAGATAVVYRAESSAGDDPVALKAYRADYDPKKTEQELGIHEELGQHENFTTLVGEGDFVNRYGHRQLFGATEFASRGTYLNAFNRVFPLDKYGTAQALGALADVSDALAHAHSNGIVIADLKTTNVVLDETMRGKVCDLGSAVEYQEGKPKMNSRGTSGYLPPESEIRPENDMFALGAMLYETLTGENPYMSDEEIKTYSGWSPEEIRELYLSRVLAEDGRPIPPPHLYNPDVPESIGELAIDLLSKDLAKRPDPVTTATRMRAVVNTLIEQSVPLLGQVYYLGDKNADTRVTAIAA